MIKRTLCFTNPAYLSVRNKQLVIKLPPVEKSDLPDNVKQECVTTRPIEDIGVLIIDNQQITLTSKLIEELLANNCALITCDAKSMPVGLMLPLSGNTIQSERFQQQIEASLPLKKQLWQQTIQAKIANQHQVLEMCSKEKHPCMKVWAGEVRSGDSENMEARAAAYYWKNLFKRIDEIKSFIRGREGDPPNNLLNYGYAILRAVIARSLVASGLLPTLGVHHHNRYNAYCLADDIMEPYRPYVDRLVYTMVEKDFVPEEGITKEIKQQLLTIPTIDVTINGKRSPLMIAAQQTTASLAKCFAGEMRKMDYPLIASE
ncbi:MAG: type II CRISPR-associated endonuclease Cas1 [Bacteroidaceae bacterium]|nr:type II CRISPR-associated endonuclease Cas1 [Bacteroidaceae bacterium]